MPRGTEAAGAGRFRHADVYPDTTDSARRIVPVLIDLIGVPARVVDVGGGVGAWSRVFLENGSTTVTCIDGPQVEPGDLMIPPASFIPWDLSSSVPEPVAADLAVCVEVAEHLPEAQGEALVDYLIRCAPVVVFSAAVPGQPGHGHVNERPAVYWKAVFAKLRYRQLDLIRPRILADRRIPYWYRQNLFVYCAPGAAENLANRAPGFDSIPDDFELVHERMLEIYRNKEAPMGLRAWLRRFPAALRQTLSQRIKGARR